MEKFTLDYIPSLPIGLRTQLYKNILPIRKLKDKVLLNKPKSQQTFQDRIDFARTARIGYDYTGSRLNKFNDNVHLEKIATSEMDIYKFTPNNSQEDTFGIYFHGGGFTTEALQHTKILFLNLLMSFRFQCITLNTH